MIKNVSYDKLAGTALGNYHLERFIGQSKIGPTFLAHADATTTYLVRFLEWPIYTVPKEHEGYLEHFQYQASQIAALQHPYILPLVDFGVFRGLPYLVSPHIPLRSLRSRIDKNGMLNTFTIGRYVDQIATALEYAHEHSVIHGSLSVDSIFIRLDGQLVVADVGVRRLLELNIQELPRNQLIDTNSQALLPTPIITLWLQRIEPGCRLSFPKPLVCRPINPLSQERQWRTSSSLSMPGATGQPQLTICPGRRVRHSSPLSRTRYVTSPMISR